eukprot:gene8405-63533_t
MRNPLRRAERAPAGCGYGSNGYDESGTAAAAAAARRPARS